VGRPVVYLACWKKPISLYPASELDEALEQQVDPYLSGRSTAKFALTKPMTYHRDLDPEDDMSATTTD
jgi:hypothetical protein